MSRHETKLYLKSGLIIITVLIIFGYGIFELWNYLTGPKITIFSPQNGVTLNESLVVIKGQGRNVKEVRLNDRPITIDESGQFTETILLSYGYNMIKLEARDRFGETTQERLQLFYK